jgi:hypothetical protein
LSTNGDSERTVLDRQGYVTRLHSHPERGIESPSWAAPAAKPRMPHSLQTWAGREGEVLEDSALTYEEFAKK